jgi:hypothetical protein
MDQERTHPAADMLTSSGGNIPLISGVDIPGSPNNDLIAGDELSEDGRNVALIAAAGDASESVDGADGDVFIGYNQFVRGGSGEDMLAGNIIATAGGRIELAARAGNGDTAFFDSQGGDGGDDNRVLAFSDFAGGGSGADRMAGDVIASGSNVRLAVNA